MQSKYNYQFNNNDYLTPSWVVELALKLAKKHGIIKNKFDCDVCCSQHNIPADKYFINGKQDGLKEDWGNFNWCNPPFNEAQKWVEKASYEALKNKTSILLLPVRPEAKYWHRKILYSYSMDCTYPCNVGQVLNFNTPVYFLSKGVKFLNPETKEELDVFKNPLCLVIFKGITLTKSI